MLDVNGNIKINPPKLGIHKVNINVSELDIHGLKIEAPQIISIPKTDIHGNLPYLSKMIDVYKKDN